MIAYNLTKEISGEKILKDIQNLIQKFREANQEGIPLLTISIRTITKDDTSLIPKLEYKNLDQDCIT